MPTNNFPNIGFITNGHDFNYFQKLVVTATSFGSNSVSGQQPERFYMVPNIYPNISVRGFRGSTIQFQWHCNSWRYDVGSS